MIPDVHGPSGMHHQGPETDIDADDQPNAGVQLDAVNKTDDPSFDDEAAGVCLRHSYLSPQSTRARGLPRYLGEQLCVRSTEAVIKPHVHLSA